MGKGCAQSGLAGRLSTTIRGERLVAPYSNGVEPPSTAAPVGATDCHHHIFDPRFPRPADAKGIWATMGDYRLFRRRLGLSRSVIVSPSTYGFDNSCLIDALDQSAGTSRGVAAVKIDTPDAELDRLHAHGVRGIRLYLAAENKKPDQLPAFARRIARLAWHIELVSARDGQGVAEAESVLLNLPCPLVIDHFGYVPFPAAVRHPSFYTIRRLLDTGRAWVKLSGVYIQSKVGHPAYSDVHELAIELIRAAPGRMLWGTDWPHTGVADQKLNPDGAALLDMLAIWAPDTDVRRRILVDNPQEFYWSP
jgi:D-galactarolactone isomerase